MCRSLLFLLILNKSNPAYFTYQHRFLHSILENDPVILTNLQNLVLQHLSSMRGCITITITSMCMQTLSHLKYAQYYCLYLSYLFQLQNKGIFTFLVVMVDRCNGKVVLEFLGRYERTVHSCTWCLFVLYKCSWIVYKLNNNVIASFN